MACVRAGVGREQAHEAIKEHSVAVALAMRDSGASENDLVSRLGSDARIPLGEQELSALMSRPLDFVGTAPAQVQEFVREVTLLTDKHPEALEYQPASIL
jgi:adenylosuccinate lyase